jgi:hypothetical protein
MLNIQQVTEVINTYRRTKGIIKKLTRTDHPALCATEAYLNSLQHPNDLLSNQDLFNINRFFLLDHPVKPGKAASYAAWFTLNYQNFCVLNYDRVTQLSELQGYPVAIEHAGFATCSKTGYQNFPEHFSKLSLEQLDNRSNAEKMQEFFNVLSQVYQYSSFTDDCFLALTKLCIEGLIDQACIEDLIRSTHADELAKSLIKLKHTDTLTTENQNFIMFYSGSFIIPITEMLISFEKANLNTLPNREILASFPFPAALQRTIKLLEKMDLLTQENFDLIQSETNRSWLLALEEIPEELITAEIWQSLLTVSKTSHGNECRKDIKDYVVLLKKKLNAEQIKKDILASPEPVKTQATPAHFFSVTPANLAAPSAGDVAPKVSFVP